MQLTRYTDYALRVLIHLAAAPGERSTIPDIARTYGLSTNHLMKVVHQLGKGGFIVTRRGRNGGFALSQAPEQITIGSVVRHAEPDMRMADCSGCALRDACGLTAILAQATAAFMAVLDSHSLAEAARDRVGLAALIAALPRPPSSVSGDASCPSPRPD